MEETSYIPKRLLADIKAKAAELQEIIDKYPEERYEIEYYIRFNEWNGGMDLIGGTLEQLIDDFPRGYGMDKEYNGNSITVEQHLIRLYFKDGDPEDEQIEHEYINDWDLQK